MYQRKLFLSQALARNTIVPTLCVSVAIRGLGTGSSLWRTFRSQVYKTNKFPDLRKELDKVPFALAQPILSKAYKELTPIQKADIQQQQQGNNGGTAAKVAWMKAHVGDAGFEGLEPNERAVAMEAKWDKMSSAIKKPGAGGGQRRKKQHIADSRGRAAMVVPHMMYPPPGKGTPSPGYPPPGYPHMTPQQQHYHLMMQQQQQHYYYQMQQQQYYRQQQQQHPPQSSLPQHGSLPQPYPIQPSLAYPPPPPGYPLAPTSTQREPRVPSHSSKLSAQEPPQAQYPPQPLEHPPPHSRPLAEVATTLSSHPGAGGAQPDGSQEVHSEPGKKSRKKRSSSKAPRKVKAEPIVTVNENGMTEL